MISNYDKQLFTEVGRKYILNIALNSNYLKEKLSFGEHLKLCNQVRELTYKEVITLTITEDIRAFEGKFKKFLKYGMAAIAGGVTMGGIWGPPIAMFILYLFRKATDTCVRACFTKMPLSSKRKICKYECQLNTAKKITTEIRSQIAKCSQFERASKCEKSLQKEYIKWAKRVQQLTVKLNQAKAGEFEKERKQRAKEAIKRAKTLRANIELPKDQIVNFIFENKTLRQQLDFKTHLKLYQISKHIQEEEDHTTQPVKLDPKKEKQIRTIMYLGLWAVPIPFFNDLINYMVKRYSVACASKCLSNKKLPHSVCYNQCAYLGAKYAVKTLNSQLSKCQKAKKPEKCMKKIYKMLEDWKQREVERKIKFEASLKREIRKAKRKNTNQQGQN